MATLDNFHREDSTGLGSSVWTADIFGSSALAPNVVSTQAKGGGSGYYNAYHTTMLGPDCYLGIQCQTVTGTNPVAIYIIPSAVGTSGADGYGLVVTGTGNTSELYRSDNASGTLLTTFTQAMSVGDYLWLSLRDSYVRARTSTGHDFFGAALIGEVTDNTHRSASSAIGFQLLANAIASDFLGGNLNAPFVDADVG
jgi:hypothetical protein